ncbi:CSS-motif domain-containing protein [Pseudomonas azotoformans]
MRRKYLRNWAALDAVSFAISVIAFSAYLAVRNGTERARDDLSDVADEVIRRSVATQAQVDEVVTAQRTAGLTPCSPDHIALMRRLLLKASHLKDLAYIKGDHMLCSVLYLSTARIYLGPASHTTVIGGRRWNRLILPNAPGTTFVINERDGYTAIITPSLVLDVEDDEPDVSITHFRNVDRNVVRSRGTFKSEWLINYSGQPTSFFDTDYFVTIKLSSDGDSSVLAAMPKARVNQMVLAAIPTYLVAGSLAGVGGAILLYACHLIACFKQPVF